MFNENGQTNRSNLKGTSDINLGESKKVIDNDTTSSKQKKRFFPDVGKKFSFYQFLFGYDKKALSKKKKNQNNIINANGEKILIKDINSISDLVITFFDEWICGRTETVKTFTDVRTETIIFKRLSPFVRPSKNFLLPVFVRPSIRHLSINFVYCLRSSVPPAKTGIF